MSTAADERHFTVTELAENWKLGPETVRRMVMNEPGVLKIRLGKKKKLTRYRVPASVAARLHSRHTA